MKIAIHLLITCLLSLMLSESHAQLVLNPKAGINASVINEEISDYEAEGRVGFNIGLDIRLPGEQAFYLNPGLHYYSYTARLIRNPGQGVELRDESRINSIKVPVRLGYRLTGEGGLIGFHVRGGVVPTFILGVKEVDGFDFDKDSLKGFSLAADLGFCIEIFNLLTADLNYELGLTDYFEDAKGSNNVLTLAFGLKF